MIPGTLSQLYTIGDCSKGSEMGWLVNTIVAGDEAVICLVHLEL